MIEIQPADDKRRDFARWALAQVPRIETASMNTSLVPSHLFADIPEDILVGALIDGTPYRHVVQDKVPEGDGYKDATLDDVLTQVVPVTEETPAPVRRTRRGTK